MSLSMFYEIVHHLLPLATAADLFVQQTMFFLGVFTYCQLTLEPDFLLIYVLQMNFALLVLLLLLSLRTHLINPLLDYRHLMRLNLILLMMMTKKLLMKLLFYLMMILALH